MEAAVNTYPDIGIMVEIVKAEGAGSLPAHRARNPGSIWTRIIRSCGKLGLRAQAAPQTQCSSSRDEPRAAYPERR